MTSYSEGSIITLPASWGREKARIIRSPRPDGVMLVQRLNAEELERITVQELTTGEPPRNWIPRRAVYARYPNSECRTIKVRIVADHRLASKRWRKIGR